MSYPESATDAGHLIEVFQDRLPQDDLFTIRAAQDKGDWPEALDQLVSCLALEGAPITPEELAKLGAIRDGLGLELSVSLGTLNLQTSDEPGEQD